MSQRPTRDRRQDIIGAARALLQGAGYDALSVDAIARKAGISKATFYAYFRTKEELRRALMAQGLDESLLPARDNREAILDAALRTFAEHGFQATTLNDIARAASVTKGTVYWYFKHKKEILKMALARISPLVARLPDLAGHLDQPPQVLLPIFAKEYLGTFENPIAEKLLRIFVSEAPREPETASYMEDIVSGVFQFMTAYLERQVALGRLRRHNVQASARSFMGSLLLYTLGPVIFPKLAAGRPPREEYVDQVISIFLQGLGTAPATSGQEAK